MRCSFFCADRCHFQHFNARNGDVVCALWLIPLYVLSYTETYHFIFHRPGIFHTRLLCRGEDRTPDKCLIREFIAYLERCRAARNSPSHRIFPHLQGMRPLASSRLVPGGLEWSGDAKEEGAGSSDSVVR